MKNQLEIDYFIDIQKKIEFGDELIFVGSCFSESIGSKVRDAGLKATINPFGVVFHPIIIADLLENCVGNNTFKDRVFQRDDIFLDWSCSGHVYDFNKEKLKNKLNEIQQNLFEKLKKAKVLFITFGTSFAYYLNSSNEIVANCHKMPNALFYKKFSSIEEMTIRFNRLTNQLLSLNSSLQIVYTVSPVRHKRDGLVNNNLSKGKLLLLCDKLKNNPNSYYFPSYEYVNDVLRDYFYFKEDGLHPNDYAINDIWNYFKDRLLCPLQKELLLKVEEYNRANRHELLYPDSIKSKEFKKKLTEIRKNLLNQNPLIQI